MKLSTLPNVRDLVEKHLPQQCLRKPTWQHVSNEIAKAADGEKDLLEICVSLRLVLALEGVECLMQWPGRVFTVEQLYVQLLKEAISSDDGDRAAKIIQQAARHRIRRSRQLLFSEKLPNDRA